MMENDLEPQRPQREANISDGWKGSRRLQAGWSSLCCTVGGGGRRGSREQEQSGQRIRCHSLGEGEPEPEPESEPEPECGNTDSEWVCAGGMEGDRDGGKAAKTSWG